MIVARRDSTADASGASELSAFDLNADNADLKLSGASEAEVTAGTTLKVTASGGSSVTYRGNAQVTQDATGGSSVSKG